MPGSLGDDVRLVRQELVERRDRANLGLPPAATIAHHSTDEIDRGVGVCRDEPGKLAANRAEAEEAYTLSRHCRESYCVSCS